MSLTLADLRTEVYELSGEIDDLDPTGSTVRLDQIINEGQRRVSFYKTKRGRRVRFPELMAQMNFQTVTVSGTAGVGTTTTVGLTGAGAEDDRYNDWIVTLDGGSDRLIVDYDGATETATVNEPYATAPVGTEAFLLYKSFERLVPSTHAWQADHIVVPSVPTILGNAEGNLVDVMKIVDLEDGRELTRAVRGQFYDSQVVTTGTPTEWYRFGNRIQFNYAIDAARWFRLEYYRSPTELVAATDTPEFDESFHFGIALWCRWWALTRQQETGYTSSAWRDFTDFMEQTVSGYESSNSRDRGPIMRINLRGGY